VQAPQFDDRSKKINGRVAKVSPAFEDDSLKVNAT